MTYDEALAFWHGRINYEVRAAAPADLKLERMRALLATVGNPHDRLRLVHITGTKGKGSTAAMIAAILRAGGYRVGLFTSPHLTDVRERIQVDGTPISARELTTLLEEIASVTAGISAVQSPTFFEIGTALGFLHFLRRRCDVGVLEVGLGGRFDSTNVCRPLVSVITSVGFDHTAQLGSTLAAIAGQKAGIIKEMVPVVSGVMEPEARDVIRRTAETLRAPLIECGRDYAFTYEPNPSRVRIETFAREHPQAEINLLGAHQAANAAAAVAAVDSLSTNGIVVPEQAILEGLARVQWPARIELVRHRPTVVLDSAHNVPSVEALVRTLRESVPVRGRKRLVFAVSADKDFPGMLTTLATYFNLFFFCRYGSNPRSVPPTQLAEILSTIAPSAAAGVYQTAAEAWSGAIENAEGDDLICVTGSVFLAGELGLIVRGWSGV